MDSFQDEKVIKSPKALFFIFYFCCKWPLITFLTARNGKCSKYSPHAISDQKGSQSHCVETPNFDEVNQENYHSLAFLLKIKKKTLKWSNVEY